MQKPPSYAATSDLLHSGEPLVVREAGLTHRCSATGRSAGAWILTGRMAEARRLLAQSEETIDVIGERVGYADATHFIRMFRRTHGLTPAAWRIAYLKEGSTAQLATPRPRTPS